jgi:hypothetical protein
MAPARERDRIDESRAASRSVFACQKADKSADLLACMLLGLPADKSIARQGGWRAG